MIIETERLILRPFEEKDAADMLEYLKKPAVNCFACMKLDSLEEAKEEARRRADDTDLYFAIVLKESGKVIGEIDAAPEATAPDEDNAPQDTFSPCWMLNEAYHGKGYGYEAAHAFFDICLGKKAQGGFILIQKTITFHASGFVKNLACDRKDYSRNLSHSSIIPTVRLSMKTPINMPF